MKTSLTKTDAQRIKRLKMSLRDCYVFARRQSIKATKSGLDDGPWRNIFKFCQSADTDGDICCESVLRVHRKPDHM